MEFLTLLKLGSSLAVFFAIVLGSIVFKSAQAVEGFISGYAEIAVTDPASRQQVRASVWYPTRTAASELKRGPFTVSVAENAPAATGPFPLIALSHGNMGSHLGHRDSAIALARSGIIVITPLHAGDNFRDQNLLGTERLLKSRPKSVSVLLDTVISDRRFPVDPDRIGFLGFSAGGFTGLALLGAKPAYAQAEKHCQSYPTDTYCKFAPVNAGPPALLDNLHDSRIKAAVLLAPLTAHFTNKQLASIKAPIYLIQAEFDQILNAPFHATRLLNSGANVQQFWTVKNAQHYSFLAPFPDAIKTELGELAIDRPGFDRIKMHQEMNAQMITFFQKTL